ncbi:MAG: hypothetical protein ACI4V7_01145 [Succinivibrionaceae bacterium]
MGSKVLFLPNFQGQELPSDGLNRYDHVYLITSAQETLPVNVVMQLFQLKQQVDIQFLQLDCSTETELLFTLAFKIAQMAIQDPEIQITFVTDNLAFDTLVSTGKKAGYKLSRADGFTRLSSVSPSATEEPAPLQPNVIQQKQSVPDPEPIQPMATKTTIESKSNEENGSTKNKKLIASLLNNK